LVGKEVTLKFAQTETKDAPALLPSLADPQKDMPWQANITLDTLHALYEKQLV